MTQKSVNDFVDSVRNQLNRNHFFQVAIWSLLALAVCMIVIALCYVIPGYAVAWSACPVVAAAIAVVGLVVALIGRRSRDQAASFADRFFEFKDSVSSCSHFEQAGHEGGFYDLQAQQTNRLITDADALQVRSGLPWRLVSTTAVLLAIAVALGFKGPSESVIKQLELEQVTLLQTEAANEEIKQLIDELEKDIDDEEEKKLLNADKLRQWVNELEKTKDLKDAMRQYARLEMKLNKAAQALSQRKDEQLLDKAAQELKEMEQFKALAKKLKQKKYDKAAKDLKDLKPDQFKAKDVEKLAEKRRELAKLKALAKRMAQAARKVAPNARAKAPREGGAQGKASSTNGKTSNSQPAEGDPNGDQEDASNENELAEMIEDLEEAVEEFDQELEELERVDWEEYEGEFEELEQCKDCENSNRAIRGQLDKLGKKLAKMARKRSARSKLKQLSKKCSQCQSGALGLARSNQPGGKRAGQGSSDTSRDQRDDMVDNGQTTQLKGLKGQGPSLTRVESTDDGTGVSHRRTAATKREFKREFKRQFESFVQREDVPEALKTGVKQYFTNIHQTEAAEE